MYIQTNLKTFDTSFLRHQVADLLRDGYFTVKGVTYGKEDEEDSLTKTVEAGMMRDFFSFNEFKSHYNDENIKYRLINPFWYGTHFLINTGENTRMFDHGLANTYVQLIEELDELKAIFKFAKDMSKSQPYGRFVNVSYDNSVLAALGGEWFDCFNSLLRYCYGIPLASGVPNAHVETFVAASLPLTGLSTWLFNDIYCVCDNCRAMLDDQLKLLCSITTVEDKELVGMVVDLLLSVAKWVQKRSWAHYGFINGVKGKMLYTFAKYTPTSMLGRLVTATDYMETLIISESLANIFFPNHEMEKMAYNVTHVGDKRISVVVY